MWNFFEKAWNSIGEGCREFVAGLLAIGLVISFLGLIGCFCFWVGQTMEIEKKKLELQERQIHLQEQNQTNLSNLK